MKKRNAPLPATQANKKEESLVTKDELLEMMNNKTYQQRIRYAAELGRENYNNKDEFIKLVQSLLKVNNYSFNFYKNTKKLKILII